MVDCMRIHCRVPHLEVLVQALQGLCKELSTILKATVSRWWPAISREKFVSGGDSSCALGVSPPREAKSFWWNVLKLVFEQLGT